MPTWLKIVLGILIGSIVICGGVVGACTLFVKGKADDINAGNEEAKKLGASGTGKDCLDKALDKNKSCGDVKTMSGAICMTTTVAFMQTCLDATSDKQSMCTAPPEKDEDGDKWAERRCTEYGQSNNDGCKAVVSLAFAHCNFGNPTPTTGDTPEEEPVPTPDDAAPPADDTAP